MNSERALAGMSKNGIGRRGHHRGTSWPSKGWRVFVGVLAATLTSIAYATPIDLIYLPALGGHDFNHAPIGQSFIAPASDVHGGLYLSDDDSFVDWIRRIDPGFTGSSPYAVAPSISVRVDLLEGEGPGGSVLYSTSRQLQAPFQGVVDVDYGGAGVQLIAGEKYTILLTDISNQVYPQGVTGWLVPGAQGAYNDGLPILQGQLVQNAAGIGDNCFQVIQNVRTPDSDGTVALLAIALLGLATTARRLGLSVATSP